MQEENGWMNIGCKSQELSEVPLPELSYQWPQVKQAAFENLNVFKLLPFFSSFLSFTVK